MPVETKESGLKKKVLSTLLAFIVGFVGVSIIGVIVLIVLLSLGILPQI